MAALKVYLSGRISGDPNYRPKFEKAEEEIREFCIESCYPGDANKLNIRVFNPATLPEGLTREEYMQLNIPMLLAADIVYFLDDYTQSEGSRVEWSLARYSEKTMVYQHTLQAEREYE